MAKRSRQAGKPDRRPAGAKAPAKAPAKPAAKSPDRQVKAPPAAALDEPFELELNAMAHGGSALGRHGKQTVFVPYTIPGERVLARIVTDRGRVAFAEGVRLLDASADRVYPRCPHFGPGRCGRCQWQHLDYEAQILIKQDVLTDQLARIGGFDDATLDAVLLPIIRSPEIWTYNYHMTLHVADDGTPGFPGSAIPGGVPGAPILIDECHIMHPDLLDLLHQLDMDVSGLTRLRLQTDSDHALMLILSVRSEQDLPELLIDFSASINLLTPDHEPANLVGDLHSRYVVGERSFRVTAGSEFRANLSQLGNLGDVVRSMLALTGSEIVLDLYSGTGFFAALIAQDAVQVVTVDSYPPAVLDALNNLAGDDRVTVLEGTVEDLLPRLDVEFDAAIVDPPAEGLSLEAVDALAERRIPRLVYVSSDPATLARDAQRLTAHGYRLAQVQPLDLNPQTYYIDAVALLIYDQA